MKELVSIIVPIYNGELYLDQCIASILNQSYPQIEVLLIDDGSTDQSGIICDRYAKRDSRVRVVHQENGGVSSARNHGLRLASGKWVQFVDSDDYLDAKMTETLVSAIQEQQTELAMCGYTIIHPDRRELMLLPSVPVLPVQKLDEQIPHLFGRYLLNTLWNKLYIREKITVSFEEGCSLGEDLFFNLAYFKNIQQLTVLDEALYFYVLDNAQSLTKKARPDRIVLAEQVFIRSHQFAQAYLDTVHAEKEISAIFIDSLFYGLMAIWRSCDLSLTEKRGQFTYWMQNANTQTALSNYSCRSLSSRVKSFVLKRQSIFLLTFVFQLVTRRRGERL